MSKQALIRPEQCYRLPQTMGRSAGQSDAKADNGSGRDLFKKFMLWRGLFPQEPPRDNIIVVPQPSPTFSTTTTPTTTTTTTTTTNNNGTSTRRWRNLENTEDLPAPTLPTSQMLDNGGAQKRVTKRHRNASKSRTRSNGKLRRQKKKKTRHRHIHKRQRQRQRRQRQLRGAEPQRDLAQRH
ncbi:uncharacterized protein Dvir_GJ15282 [Drosophila virilis]|uniref:Uncharacterized protein n=1 Tax=Drosophila virilis TaxID=7244 RepID=B4MCQ9_DROVI|nr:uncharacterized protein Dvir_GJ15282 [Drosophila virilis]